MLINALKGIRINRSFFKRKVVKDFTAVAGTNLALRPIQLIKGFVVAKYLGPADYGLLKSIELIQMLNKYGSLGFNTTAAREVGHALANDDTKRIQLIRNTAYSSELVLSLLLFMVGMCSSLFFESRTVSILIILASFGLLASKLRGILATEAVIQKKFILTSKITFITVTAASIIVIVTVPFFKIYAVLFTNIVIGMAAIALFVKPLRFRFSFNIQKTEFKRILRISVPLTFGSLSLASFKYSERILLLSYLGSTALGLFSFAEMVASQISVIIKASIKVRIQDIYENLGKERYTYIHTMVMRETILLTAMSLLFIPVLWVAIHFLVPLFLPNWTEGVFVAQLFLFSLPFTAILNYPSAVLVSSVVNKQGTLPAYRFGSTGLLILGTLSLNILGELTLEYFIILNIICQAYYNMVILVLYKKYFINPLC